MASRVATPVRFDYPTVAGDIDLRIQAGACRLRIIPSDSDAWVIASFEDPRANVEVTGQVEANRLTIHVRRSPADFFGFLDGTPEVTLELGKARRYSLTIEAGASESKVELGGLPISRLAMSHGAGSLHVTFSGPNPEEMSELKLGVGAGRTEASSLGNAKFHNLIVDGGAAACVLDFGGAIPFNANARISTAMGSVELRIPGAVAAEIMSEHLLGQTRAEAGFVQRDSTWLSQAAAEGRPIALRIHTSMVMGQLQLRS